MNGSMEEALLWQYEQNKAYFEAHPLTEGLGLNRPSDLVDRRAQQLRAQGYMNDDAYNIAIEEWSNELHSEGDWEPYAGGRCA